MLLFALAVAAAPVPDLNDPDLRCIAALAVIGAQSEKVDPGLASGVFYFLGRLDARAPHFDIEAGIRALVSVPDAAKKLAPDMVRCGSQLAARGAFLKAMGDSMQGKK
jgi:hypothetical protein